jgi:hypothetical protein
MPRLYKVDRKVFTTAQGARDRARRNLPKASNFQCVDCGDPASDYDHYDGYSIKNWNKVDPVCRSCHAKREFKRGTRGVRSRQILVGPRMEKGYFFTQTGRKGNKTTALWNTR